MADIALGYGSEWQVLRFLGRHRAYLDRLILERVPGQRLEWLDFRFDQNPKALTGDRELAALEFLRADDPARVAWREVWPTSGNPQNWDAVALLDSRSWVLVEAKANLEELGSSCGAKGGHSLQKIDTALCATRDRLGASPAADWKTPYYQYANRLVVLEHLLRHGHDVHLLNIYFCGDKSGPGRTCPKDESGWVDVLARQQQSLGLPDHHDLSDRVHRLFVEVRPIL